MTGIGVVGLGYWGSKVVEEYVDLREDGTVDRVVACDMDAARLEAVEGVDERFEELEAALERVDGLHVCTPIGTHAAVGRQALDAGVDLLVEKPFTEDRDSAFELMRFAMEQDRLIQTGHIYRFANVIKRLRELYYEGRFGEVHTVTMRWTHEINPPSGTDVLWDLGPHPIDIINYVTGDWPSNEYCRTRTKPDADGPVSATAQFDVADADVIVQLSWRDAVKRRSIEVAGTEASAVVDAVEQEIEVFDDGDSYEIEVEPNNTIRAEATNFVEAIQTRHNTANSAVVGVRAVEAIERLQEVSERGGR